MSTFLEDFNTSEQRAVVKLVCENSLKAYIKLVHYYTTGSKFIFKPFHNEVIQKLEDIAFYRSTKNLLLNLPVGFGKSAIVEYFKSWCFARNKNICFLYTSYSDKLIVKLSSEIMEIMNSEIYKTLWGYTFKKDKKSKANWSIEGAVGRAGLTAGSIGGTVTGLDAGNPAIEGFCGALVCFPYDEQVWTNKGKLKIGDIVENKLDVKIYSYNHDKKHIELQPIEAYVKNKGDDIVRVTMKNGESFECTKNHRVWTINRGYVEAKDLIGGIDIVISLPNALNLWQVRDVLIDNITFVGYEVNSYCLTVHNNHNMFVGKNEGFLVKNCDDPMKAGDEIYETKRDLVTEYFDRKLVTRLRRSDVPIIIVMQRLHEEDLTGYIKREGKYGSGLTKEQKESWRDNWDCVTVRALENEKSIWEEKVSTKTLIEERDRSPFVFYPQRQQEPNSNLNTHFKGLQFESDVKRIYNGIGHVDKAFGGEDSTAFTIANRVAVYDDEGNYIKDDIIMLGKKWDKHIDECIEEINALAEKYRCGTVYTENNDDKGYTAKNNDNFAMYHEHQNKHYKIMTYLYSNWKDIKFLEETDEDYIRQIQSYNEKSKHDDCPDSASSVIRLLEGEGVSVVSGIMV